MAAFAVPVPLLVFNPEFAAQINSFYLKTTLGLDDQQYRRAYEIIRAGFTSQLALVPQRQAVWAGVYDRLETASDQELLEKRKELQAINMRMPEINVGMIVQLRNLLPPEKRVRFGKILKKQFPIRASLRPKSPSENPAK